MSMYKKILCFVESTEGSERDLTYELAHKFAECHGGTVSAAVTGDIDKLPSVDNQKLHKIQPEDCASELLALIDEHNYDLLIKAHESKVSNAKLDSQLVRQCPCPVLLLDGLPQGLSKRIAVAVDVDDGYSEDECVIRNQLNHNAVETAVAAALLGDSISLDVIYSMEIAGESTLGESAFSMQSKAEVEKVITSEYQRHEALLSEFCDQAKKKMMTHQSVHVELKPYLIKGSATKNILRAVKDLDSTLLVIGTVARTGLSRWIMGNTAESVLKSVECSLLAIKPDNTKDNG